jgi:clan AA aspartic protease (TIGR02281 family)
VESFYSQTFANGREERMLRAFAMGEDYSVVEKLSAAIEALNAEPKLGRAETPAGLTRERLEIHIRKLLTSAIEQGLYEDVARVADVNMLQRLGDQSLLPGVVAARVHTYGIQDGLQFLDELAAYFPNLESPVAQRLLEVRGVLLRQALGEALEKDDRPGAMQVYEEARTYFPDDAELHLVGVELTLMEYGWQEAERLLNDMQYPVNLQDRARLLAMEIDTQRRNEQRIVIRFQPGSKFVSVSAYVNDALSHDFVIDTGASMVVVPNSALARLGLKISEDAPAHHIATAGGIRVARQIHLDSLEIDGWREDDIDALVLDIPGQPDLGLIGMNFLSRFQMDLKTDEGVLMLTPVR